MKKILFAISAIAVLLGFTACTSENETLEPQKGGKTILKAYTEETTRTTLNGNDTEGYKVFWSTGDKIKIVPQGQDPSSGTTYTFNLINGEGTTTGTFEGSTLTAGEYTAYYKVNYSGTGWPKNQTYVAGNIPSDYVPMKATGITVNSDGTISPISFKNEGGILRLNLKGYATIKVTKIVISATGLANDITLNSSAGVALNPTTATPFHIAVPAGTYSGLKIVISYKDAANQTQECTKTAKSAITIERSKITKITLSPEFNPGYLCFEAKEADAKIIMRNFGEGSGANVEYSKDLKTWEPINTTTSGYVFGVTLASGDKVYFRGNNPDGFNKSSTDYTNFEILKKVSASGNVMSLIDPSCAATTIPCEYCFWELFLGCTGLTTAPKLPATTLTEGCYQKMFRNCKGLTQTPLLPATNLAKRCYQYMFDSCESLESAPTELPATTLAESCYCGMFYKCTKLENAPKLPATTLVKSCYSRMFEACDGLVSAPDLPAPTLVESCYAYMFYSCGKLNYIKCLATDIAAMDCLKQWVNSAGNGSGTFVKATGMSSWPTGMDGIPTSWTIYSF